MSRIAFAAVSFALLTTSATTHLVNINNGVKAVSSHPAAVHKTVPKPAAKPAPVVVTVQAGDTLNAIADSHSTTYVRLYDANTFISDPNVIHAGDQVRIPTADEQLPDRPLPADASPDTSNTASAPVATTASAVSYPAVSGNDAKAFIYAHESGNNPNAMSANGCYGLGQNCSGAVLAQCGADYACQDAFFTNYAISRYGSWENAAAFWQANGWW